MELDHSKSFPLIPFALVGVAVLFLVGCNGPSFISPGVNTTVAPSYGGAFVEQSWDRQQQMMRNHIGHMGSFFFLREPFSHGSPNFVY